MIQPIRFWNKWWEVVEIRQIQYFLSIFDRSKRNVSLTEARKAFLEHARKINMAYKALVVDLNGYKSETDSFSIAAIPVITQYGITAYIAQFQDLCSDIHFNLEEIHGQNIFPALEERRFNVAITRHNFLDHDKFKSFEIRKDKLLVVVSPKKSTCNPIINLYKRTIRRQFHCV